MRFRIDGIQMRVGAALLLICEIESGFRFDKLIPVDLLNDTDTLRKIVEAEFYTKSSQDSVKVGDIL